MLSHRAFLKLAMHPRVGLATLRKIFRINEAVPEFGCQPNFDSDGLRLFESKVSISSCMIEYGAGASTIFAVKRGVMVISVETDRRYANAVNAKLRHVVSSKGSEVIFADIGPTLDWGKPIDTYSTPRNRARWRAYIEAPWQLLARRNIQPDVVLIDGRFRVACAAYAWLHLRANSSSAVVLLDDYVGRPEYAGVQEIFAATEVGRMALLRPLESVNREVGEKIFDTALSDHR